nr:plasmid recombination protein [Oscillospiraceae bacterium]
MENEVTISTHNGSQVARQHNLRNPKVIAKEEHIDPNGHFEVWKDEDPKEAYERLFGDAVQTYNAKQTREDRKITDYYGHICQDKKKHPVYELIIGIYGKKADGTPICSKNDGRRILRAFVEDWERRNPNLKICGVYYHCDESVGVNGSQVGHVHIDYIPVGEGFSRGMATQSSLSKALEQQGFISQGLNNTAQIQWEARENQFLATLCTHAGFEVIRDNSGKEHLDTATYKKVKELQDLREKESTLVQSIAQKEQEYEEIQDRFETLKAQKSLSQTVMEAYAEPEYEIEVQHIPAKTNPITKHTTPAQVTMAEADYLILKERAAASTWIRKAMEDLKHMGAKLTRELNQRRRVAELQEQATSAEIAARAAELNLTNARAEIADLRQQAQEQQDWMEQQTTRSGKTIWDFFIDFISKQREREYIDRNERY